MSPASWWRLISPSIYRYVSSAGTHHVALVTISGCCRTWVGRVIYMLRQRASLRPYSNILLPRGDGSEMCFECYRSPGIGLLPASTALLRTYLTLHKVSRVSNGTPALETSSDIIPKPLTESSINNYIRTTTRRKYKHALSS